MRPTLVCRGDEIWSLVVAGGGYIGRWQKRQLKILERIEK
jgi:hypothetical protein